MSRGSRAVLVARPDVAAERADDVACAGVGVETVTSVARLEETIEPAMDCVVTGHDLPDGDALEVLERVREVDASLPVVVYTDAGSETLAGAAIAAGAAQYVSADADDASDALDDRVATAIESAAPEAIGEDDATASRDGYRTLVDTVGDPMYVLDAAGQLQTVNDAMAEHLGYDREEILGEHVSAFMPEEDVRRGTEAIQQLLASDDQQWVTFEMRSLDADGETAHNEAKVAALTDEDGDFVGSVGVIRDITERKRYETELERQNERLGRFASIVSHDLRNPLTVAEGHLAELREQLVDAPATVDSPATADASAAADSPTAADASATADGSSTADATATQDTTAPRDATATKDASATDTAPSPGDDAGHHDSDGRLDHVDHVAWAHERMRVLIEDLLVLAQQGKALDDLEPVSLPAAIEESWTSVRAENASVVVETDARIRADRSRLCQLLENCFGNAVEHGSTSPGSQARQDAAGRETSSEPSLTADREDAVEHGSTSPGSQARQDTAGRETSSEPSLTADREDAVEHGSTSPGSQAHQDAAEHGGDGVTVTVGDLPAGDGFYVADDGPGIPPEDRDAVLEVGYTTATDGTGFGLSIVREVADAHGWTVDVTASDDGGARFEIGGVDVLGAESSEPTPEGNDGTRPTNAGER